LRRRWILATRTLPIEVLIPNAEGALKPGGFATAEITVGRAGGARGAGTARSLTFAGVHKVIVHRGRRARRRRRVMLGARARVDHGPTALLRRWRSSAALTERGDDRRSPRPSSLTTGPRVRIVERAAGASGQKQETGGGTAVTGLGVDRLPSLDMPTVRISTTLAGAAPEEIETESRRHP
jgi:hypothetical protein